MCPPSKFTRFRAQHISDCRVGVHKPSGNDEANTEETPSDPLKSPEYIGVSDVFEPEVFCIEMRQREKATERDKRAQRPEQIRLQFAVDTAPPVTAPSVPKDTPY